MVPGKCDVGIGCCFLYSAYSFRRTLCSLSGANAERKWFEDIQKSTRFPEALALINSETGEAVYSDY